MTRGTYSGEEIIRALGRWGFKRVGQGGSHVKLQYEHPVTGERRTVIVPLHEELSIGTLQNIAKQAGANDFNKFIDTIEELI